MSPLKILILWIVAALLSVALLFPPFGYTGYELNSTDPKVVAIATPTKFSCPWTYLAHRFIFGIPPYGDTGFVERMGQVNESVEDFKVSISWQFVAVECAVILLLGVVAFATVGKSSN